jgi:hypothetical protein
MCMPCLALAHRVLSHSLTRLLSDISQMQAQEFAFQGGHGAEHGFMFFRRSVDVFHAQRMW